MPATRVLLFLACFFRGLLYNNELRQRNVFAWFVYCLVCLSACENYWARCRSIFQKTLEQQETIDETLVIHGRLLNLNFKFRTRYRLRWNRTTAGPPLKTRKMANLYFRSQMWWQILNRKLWFPIHILVSVSVFVHGSRNWQNVTCCRRCLLVRMLTENVESVFYTFTTYRRERHMNTFIHQNGRLTDRDNIYNRLKTYYE